VTDYQGRVRITLQGLNQIEQLDDRLASIEERADSVRQAIAGIGNALNANRGKINQAFTDLANTRQERLSAQQSIKSTAQRRNAQRGTFLQGPGPNARRLANARLRAANIDTQNAQLELGQALQERNRLVQQGVVQRGRRLQSRTLPALVLGADRVARKREAVLKRATESASATGQQLRLESFDAQYQRRLQAFRRGGGGTNAPNLIQKVFEITQAFAAQKRIISATGDLSAKVTRKQAAELSTLSEALGRYNEAQLEANRLARGRVERLSGARKLGDRLRSFEAASGTARDPKTGELLFPNVTRSPFPRQRVQRARQLVNRAASAAESGDQELFRLASFQAENIIKTLEAGVKAGLKNAAKESVRGSRDLPGSPAYLEEQRKQQSRQLQRAVRMGGPRESIKGRKEVVGSPAYYEEQQKQLQRAVRAGGPRESIQGRKNLPGSPAYLEEQRRQLQRAVRAGGPRESVKGRKDLPGSPAYLEEQRRQQSQQLQKAVRMGGPRESIGGRKEIVGSPAYYEEQRKQLQRAVRAGGPRESIGGRKNLPGSPAYLEEQRRQQSQQLQKAIRAGGPRESIGGRKDLVGSPAYYEEQKRQLQKAVRMGGPRESIKGRKDLPGSPAYLEEQRKQLERAVRAGGPSLPIRGMANIPGSPAAVARSARLGGPREPIRGRKDLPGSPAYLEEQRKQQERVAKQRQISSPIRGTANMPGSPEFVSRTEKAVTDFVRKQEILGKFQDRLNQLSAKGANTAAAEQKLNQAYSQSVKTSVQAQEGFKRSVLELTSDLRRLGESVKTTGASVRGPASPIMGTPTMVGSPRWKAAQQRQQRQQRQQGFFRGDARKAIGEGLIGGAFPLLFGQGLGASIGGFAGGATGGLIGGSFGFGLSLVGTAVGQAVDNTSSSLKELAASLKSPTDAIAALEASGFRVSDSIKFQVQQLQSVGRAYDAQTLALREVQKRLGPGAITELAQLDAAQKNLQEQWGAIAAEIQVRLIPVLQGFVEFLGSAADDIGGFANQSRLQRLDPNKFEQLRTQAIRETARGPFGSFGDKKAFDARLNELSRQELSRRFAGERGKVKLSPQEAAADVETQVQESRKIADQVQSAYREAFKLQRQAYDLQRDGAEINKEIADYNYKKEQRIFDLRQQAAEKEIENRRGRAQNRIESGDLNLRQAFAGAVGLEQQLLSNVREVMRTRMEGEADIEQSRKKLELAMAKLNRDAEDYKRTTSREIDDIERRKLAYVRSVEDYKMQVADYVLQRARESADLTRQAMTLPDMGAGAGGRAAPAKAGAGTRQRALPTGTAPSTLMGVPGVIEYLTGDKGSPGYRADHGGSNYHEHIAFASRKIRDDVISMLRRNGIAIGSTDGGRHAPGSYHYRGQAVDIPAAQVPVGQEDALARRVRALVAAHLGGNAAPSVQAQAASQVSDVPRPKFTPVPIGAAPAAAPINATRMNVLSRMAGGEKEAQKILEDQIKLKEKGVELGQIEQILQGNQLPQLEQQGDALRRQVEARRLILNLSDRSASVVDAEAERAARLAQIEKDRSNALAKARKSIANPQELGRAVGQINKQADLAAGIAKKEEEQRRKNLSLTNELQNQDRVRTEILQLQENLAIAQAEAVALETGRLEAKNSELLKASTLYREADDAQRARLEALTIETEELQKQNEFRKQANQLRLDAQLTGAGLRAGFVGAGARAFEQGMRDFDGNIARATELANQAKVLENQQLVWGRLEQNIVDVSEAISGGLTNGLLDIVSGAKSIEDVGREMLSRIAGTFAESAQQQLSTLMQRQLGGLLGGAQGPLVKMLGGGAEAVGSQGLGAASAAAAGSVWGLSGAAVAAGAALQAIAGQAAFSGSLAGFGGLGSFGGSAFSGGGSGNILDTFLNPPNIFGGFMASGGVTSPNKGYVVGENEPEFFFPGVTGRVVPASDMQKAAALQQANASNEPIDVRYTVTEQRGERYVTEQQFREGMAATSKRAQAMTYAGMRNNKNIRDYVAI
jgi:hypothetical protein